MAGNTPDVDLIDFKEAVNKKFPVKYDFRIHISAKAYEDIAKHASDDKKIEIGGVLIGFVCTDNYGYFLDITDILAATQTHNTMSNVTFTHESWSDILNRKDEQFGDKFILGWYHSHPDFDIFLSSQDLHIHQNFFNQPHQVAFVIDPVKNEEGFFIWKNGKPKLSDEYWVGNKKKVRIEKRETDSKPDDKNEKDVPADKKVIFMEKALKWLTAALYMLLVVALLYMNLRSSYMLAASEEENKKYEMILSIFKSEMDKAKNGVNDAQTGNAEKSDKDARGTPPSGAASSGQNTGK